jgi:hypothetical protein
MRLHDAAVERRMGLLEPAEQQQLRRLLEKLRAGLSEDLASADN